MHRIIYNFFHPQKDRSYIEQVAVFVSWSLVLWVSAEILDNHSAEWILNNKVSIMVADFFCSIMPPVKKYLVHFKTDKEHSQIMIVLGYLGFVLFAIFMVRNFKFTLNRQLIDIKDKSRKKGGEIFVAVIFGFAVISTLAGRYPERLLNRYGVNPEHSLFLQGLWSFAFGILYYLFVEILVIYFIRNHRENMQK